jgi:hypothetical protein
MLKQYLSDALAGQAKKRVATRNKKFLLAFADDCNEILEYLGFVLEQGERTDGLVSPLTDVTRLLKLRQYNYSNYKFLRKDKTRSGPCQEWMS